MIRLSEQCANIAFGGPKRNRLFMTASLCAVYVGVRGGGGVAQPSKLREVSEELTRPPCLRGSEISSHRPLRVKYIGL